MTHSRRQCVDQGGFTLVELMVTVVIVGILASLAYPSFLSQVRKGRRSDAADLLAQVMQAQERHRGRNTSYSANATADLGFGSTTSKGGYYTLALSAASASGYTATISAVAGKSQAADTGCTTMAVTVGNGNASYAQPACWSR